MAYPRIPQLSVSNMAWTGEAALTLLSRLGVKAIEVSPARLGEWHELGRDRLRAYGDRLFGEWGLGVSSIQITLDRPDIYLLGDHPDALYHYIRHNAWVASELGANVIALGIDPQTPHSPQISNAIAVNRLRIMGSVAFQFGQIIAIKPTGNFLERWEEILSIVMEADSPSIGICLNITQIINAGSDIQEAIRGCEEHLVHFQIADPNFYRPMPSHQRASKTLREIKYQDSLVLDMTTQPVSAINEAIGFAQRTYSI